MLTTTIPKCTHIPCAAFTWEFVSGNKSWHHAAGGRACANSREEIKIGTTPTVGVHAIEDTQGDSRFAIATRPVTVFIFAAGIAQIKGSLCSILAIQFSSELASLAAFDQCV